MNRTIRIILAAASIALATIASSYGKIVTTNASGGITTTVLAPDSLSNPLPSTTASNLVVSVPAGVTKAVSDGYNVFKNFSMTNPVSIGVFGLKNGSGYGFGLEANEVNQSSAVNAGFALAAIQTETTDALGKKHKGLDFYDATVNLSLSTTEIIPVLNIPVLLRIFSGPFASLNGGVLIGEQSGTTGDVNIQVGKDKYIDLGGGVVNCAGAAAAKLKPVMPMAHLNFTFKF